MWLKLPMSHYLAAPVDSTSDWKSLSLKLAACVMSSGKDRRPEFWRRVLKKGRLLTRLSGATCEPFQAGSIVAAWLESLAASRAKIYRWPEPARESIPGSVPDSGGTSLISYAQRVHDGSLLKMYRDYSGNPVGSWNPITQRMEGQQIGLFVTSTPYLGRFPNSGSMRNGSLFPRPEWGPITAEKESSYWPTATGRKPDTRGADLQEATLWATPNTPNGGRRLSPKDVANRGATDKGKRQVPLDMEVEYWSTPKVAPGLYTRDQGRKGAERQTLEGEAATWPTPATRDYRSPNSKSYQERGGGVKGEQLANATSFWTTPTTQDEHQRNQPHSQGGTPLTSQANDFQSSPSDPKTNGGPTCWCGVQNCGLVSHKRKLNPFFEAWLMGWPLWWVTSEPQPCARSAMELYRSRLRSHLSSLLGARSKAASGSYE